MVKRINMLIMMVSSLLLFGSLAYLFIITENMYSYSRFIFDKFSLLTLIVVYSISVFILIIALILCRNNVVVKAIVLLPLTFFVWWASMVCSGFVVGNFWKSEVVCYEDFHGADTYLEKEVKIAGLSIEDITQKDVEYVEDFEYAYQARLLHSTFKLEGKFVYSKETYNAIKQTFLLDPEFTEVIYTDVEQDTYKAMGCFQFHSTLPEYQTKTNVDEWETLLIQFDDETHSFYFELYGDYDT